MKLVMRSVLGLECGLVLALGAFLSGPGRAGEPDGKTLDLMDNYWRYHLTFSAARVSLAELVKLGTNVAKPGLGRPFHFDLGWYAGHGTSTELAYLISSPPPAPDWAKPDFNDASWARNKRPFLTGGASHLGLAVGLACFRARVIVDDPERAAGLKLDLTYRGGVVVYVNGQELARGHLPKGALQPEAAGEDYPVEAYVLGPSDLAPNGNRQRPVPELWKDVFPGPNSLCCEGCRGWLEAVYKSGPQKLPISDLTAFHRMDAGNWAITREEYGKMRELRDRRLGPVEIPKSLLRKGLNVIAIEVHRSDLNPVVHDGKRLGATYGWGYFGGTIWMHGLLKDAKVTLTAPGTARAEERPAGVQVWTEDIHRRCFSPEFGPPDQAPAPLRLVGARNGAYSAQALLGTAGALGEVSASVGELASSGGGKIPATAVTVRYGAPLPVATLAALGTGRGSAHLGERDVAKSGAVISAVSTYGPKGGGQDIKALSQTIAFFDQLSAAAPKAVPADSCLPVWVTVRVPRDAQPGEYQGELSIAAGGSAHKVPVRLWVMDWKLPDPADFETVMALEQSPYGVARHYNVKLWSDEHFKLLEGSFRLLAEVGNDFLVIPVLTGSEFGNGGDSMIRWVRGAGGAWECDFTAFDRYLELACKYLKPRCVCFVVGHPTDNSLFVKPQVVVREGDKTTLLDVPKPGTDEARALWKPMVEGARKRLADRGLDQAMHWGFYWDTLDFSKSSESGGSNGYCDGMFKLMAELAPDTGWTRGCHNPRGLGKDGFTFLSTIYYFPSCFRRDKATGQLGVTSFKGWKNPLLHLVLPRVVNTVITVEGISPPLCYRVAPERAIVHGARGVARIGADYWADAYQSGWRGGCQVGMPVATVLWPGPGGAESGARFECLKEGVQETEARIFLERKMEGQPGREQAKSVEEMLARRVQETLHIPPTFSDPRISEYYGGWQERSWDLYAAAAAIGGGRAPSAEDKTRFFGTGAAGK